MKLTVRDALEMGILDKMTLVAGEGGLAREITKAGVLEYELITGSYGNFCRGELILSSLMHAHNNEALLLQALAELNHIGISGLAVKTILFDELPPSVLDFAQSVNLPVFTFGDDLYYEDIILPIAAKINIYHDYDHRGQLIEKLLQNQGNTSELTQELNITGLSQPVCMVFRCKGAMHDKKRIIAFLESPRVKNLFAPGSVGIAFKNGFLILLSSVSVEGSPHNYYHGIVKNLGINTADYFIGISNPHPVTEVIQCIREGYFATKVALLTHREVCLLAETGSYQILMRDAEDSAHEAFSESMLGPLTRYDAETGGNLYETALCHVRKKGQLKDTAAELFQHVNTIRYRINKMKNLLNYSDSDYVFFTDISLAVRIHLLSQIP